MMSFVEIPWSLLHHPIPFEPLQRENLSVWSTRLTSVFFRAAWKLLEDMPADQAQQEYVDLVDSLCPGWQEQGTDKPATGGPGGPVFSSLVNSMEDSQTGPVIAHTPSV